MWKEVRIFFVLIGQTTVYCSICNLKFSAKQPYLICFCCNLYHHPNCVNINSNAFINFYSIQWMCHSCVNSVFPFYSIDNEEFSDLFKNCYLKNFCSDELNAISHDDSLDISSNDSEN